MKLARLIFGSAISAIALISISGNFAKSESLIVEGMSCGGGCLQSIKQIGPVSKNQYGYIVVPVSTTRLIYHEPSSTQDLGESWIVVDCNGRRVGRGASDKSGGDASWTDAFINYNEPNNCEAYCGRAYDQWRLLCNMSN